MSNHYHFKHVSTPQTKVNVVFILPSIHFLPNLRLVLTVTVSFFFHFFFFFFFSSIVPANRWLSSHTECDWAGILCDEMEQVRSIDLHGQGIQGPFPTILTKIPYAQTVSMQWNEFTGSLPEDIGSMKHLIHLELHHNSFTGSFPTTWSNARNLQLLNIAENFLDGQLPSDMGNFRNIKGLYMYRNNFSGTLPPELSNSKTMRKYIQLRLLLHIVFVVVVAKCNTIYINSNTHSHLAILELYLFVFTQYLLVYIGTTSRVPSLQASET